MTFAFIFAALMAALSILIAALQRRFWKAACICRIAQGCWAFTFGAVAPLAYPPSWTTLATFGSCIVVGLVIIDKGVRTLLCRLEAASLKDPG